jgi:hypothetical protein
MEKGFMGEFYGSRQEQVKPKSPNVLVSFGFTEFCYSEQSPLTGIC